MRNFTIEEVCSFIRDEGPKSKIYIGCDSSVFKKNGKWFADYVTVVVVHKNGNQGCKIFGRVETEPDYAKSKAVPRLRLMNEVYKATNLYSELIDAIDERSVEIHLDINTDEKYNSSMVLREAIGYVKGVTGVEPKVKPNAFASSYAADRFMRKSRYDITAATPAKLHRKDRKRDWHEEAMG